MYINHLRFEIDAYPEHLKKHFFQILKGIQLMKEFGDKDEGTCLVKKWETELQALYWCSLLRTDLLQTVEAKAQLALLIAEWEGAPEKWSGRFLT